MGFVGDRPGGPSTYYNVGSLAGISTRPAFGRHGRGAFQPADDWYVVPGTAGS